jgi:predicted dehydrogenase
MKEAVGMGVVGAGAIGIRGALTHLTMPDVQDRVRVVAICDPAPGRAEAAAKQFGVPAFYLTYEELLADPQVDAVTLCTPIGLHYEQGRAAIAAGKHVHFNKTMTTTADEATNLIDQAAEADVRLVASPGSMLHPCPQRARKLILDDRLGQLVWAITGVAISDYHLEEEFRQGDNVLSNIDPTWYFRPPGGGPLYDVVVYVLHPLTGILGPAQRVTALSGLVRKEIGFRGRTIQAEMDDSTFMLLDFGDSLFAFTYGTVFGRVETGKCPNIYGVKGAIVGGRFGEEALAHPEDHPPHVAGPHRGMAESHVFEDLMQLVDWIRDGTPSLASAEHARHVIDIFESAYRSAETGETQELRTTFEPMTQDELEGRLQAAESSR